MARQKWICKFVLLELLLLSLAVQESEAGTQANFEKYDRNHDGDVTYDEADKMFREPPFTFPFHKLFSRWLFTEWDENGDGQLNTEEFTQLYAEAIALKKERLEEYGSEGDEYITYDEASDIMHRVPFLLMGRMFQRLFEMFDKDFDRRLNTTEFALFYAEATASTQALFEKYDWNRDGCFTYDEANKMLREPPFSFPFPKLFSTCFFPYMDGNGDRQLNKEEFTSFYGITTGLLKNRLEDHGLEDDEYITKNETKDILRLFPFQLRDPEFQRLFAKFDKDVDKRLNNNEIALLYAELTASKIELRDFQFYDRNHDGYVRFKEAKKEMQLQLFILPYKRAFFFIFDDDFNKKLDIEEFKLFYATTVDLHNQISDKFELLDRDNDGKLSESEAVKFDFDRDDFNDEDAQRMFLRFDNNKSGYLDMKELAKMLLWAREYNPNSPTNKIRSPEK